MSGDQDSTPFGTGNASINARRVNYALKSTTIRLCKARHTLLQIHEINRAKTKTEIEYESHDRLLDLMLSSGVYAV